MRTLEHTSQFNQDFKREKRGQRGKNLEKELKVILQFLLNDLPLTQRHEDHPLTGQWKGFRDCHVRPDLILIYRARGASVLQLVRLGSHSELGL